MFFLPYHTVGRHKEIVQAGPSEEPGPASQNQDKGKGLVV